MENKLTYNQVFVPGGFPQYTYNPRKTLDLESKISSVRDNLCKLVVVTGHTKSGKTVLVQKMLPREECVWIDGGTIESGDDLWTSIIDELDIFQSAGIEKKEGSGTEVSGEINVEANALVLKGGTKVTGATSNEDETSTTQSRNISSRITALKGLRDQRTPLIIDDFHYLPKDLQGDVVRALKPLIFNGVPVIFIAIPHRRYDAVKVEKEMTGRIFPVDIPLWDPKELKYIPETGFELLKINLEKEILNRLSEESFGSPHLTQEFCRGICKIYPLGIGNSKFVIPEEDLEKVFKETAETIGRPIFEKLARGPRTHGDRKLRKLKDGTQADIYELVLLALSHLQPGLVTLEYEDLRTAIKEICTSEDVPNIQEVARVLKHMTQIASTDQSSSPVIDFDEETKILHITDPFFAFYLKWGSLER